MRILLVEDEKNLLRYLKQGLEEEGYAVDTAEDGSDALLATQVTDYSVVVLDLMIPQVSGIDVCRQIRKRGQNTPILMLTARDAVEDRILGLDAGADDYLVKPFAFDELLARLRAVSRRSLDVVRSVLLEVGDLQLNTITKTAHREGMKIELTAKEFSLLECLMREPDRVFSRQLIAEQVWDSHSFTESNVVDVYIRNLRRKIDDPFAQKLIGTIRGLGYRISARGDHETP